MTPAKTFWRKVFSPVRHAKRLYLQQKSRHVAAFLRFGKFSGQAAQNRQILANLPAASSSSLSCCPSGLHFACAKPPNLGQLASQAAQACLVAQWGSILLTQNRQAWPLYVILSGAIAEPKFCGSRALPERAKPRERQSCDRRDLRRMTNSFPDGCYIHYAIQRK